MFTNLLKKIYYEKYSKKSYSISSVDLIVGRLFSNKSKQEPETHTQSLEYIVNTNLYKLLLHNNYKLINWVNSDLFFVKKNLDLNAI